MARLLENKVVIVAGLGGIGNGLARRFADEGAHLVIGDLDTELALRVAEDLDPSGERVRGVPLDGADEESVISAVSLAVDTFGGLHGMHQRLQHGDACCQRRASSCHWRVGRRAASTPVVSPACGSAIDCAAGAIVFASINASATAPRLVDEQGAELALMRHIARRYGPRGIRANAIAPGLIWHYKFDEQPMPDGVVDQVRARQMIKSRFGKPDDIAALSALLLSDDGSFITAQTISVDGGVTFRP
jgi:NAD(P)-dependent dehydrogenase (short-subunit alcohol dehydrogenase family)